MNISEMIAEGNRLLDEEKRLYDEKEAAIRAMVNAEQEKVYQSAKEILPGTLGDFLSRDEANQPQVHMVSKFGVGSPLADSYQTLVLSVPACAPIQFGIYLNTGDIRNIKSADVAYGSDGDPYFTFLVPYEYDNFFTALAMAEKNYTKMGQMQASVTARKLTKQQEQIQRPDYLKLADAAAYEGSPQTAAALALCGILEYLRNQEE